MKYCNIDRCIESYMNYLVFKQSPKAEKRFKERYNSTEHKESCIAEAVLCSFMQLHNYSVEINDDPSTGGVDFYCQRDEDGVFLEVTTIKEDTMASSSGWDKNIPSEIDVSSFTFITSSLRTRLSRKAPQLADHHYPRVLAICSMHHASIVLLGPSAAEKVLVGDTILRVPLESDEPIQHVTGLYNSAFFRFENNILVPCRRSISAVLLFAIYENELRSVGILHPDPQYVLPIHYFSRIPFLRLTEWPPNRGSIKTEWVQNEVNSYPSLHKEIEIPESDLR